LLAAVPVVIAVFSATTAPSAEKEPAQAGLHDSVEVNLVPLEVTVWPKAPDSDACLGLTIDDFELRVDDRPQSIYAVDALGAMQETYRQDAAHAGDASPGGISFVLFFDLWHLDLFYQDFPACPATKPLAFAEARRFIDEEFHDGDRLLLVTAAGWPVVHEGWIRTRAEAAAAIDRLKKDRQVMAPRQEHLHHNGWIAGIESLFLALGRYPGRKDVIYLADDFRFDDVALRMYDIAARAQANGVVMSSMDLLASCRRVVGIPCIKVPSGLGCTEWRDPIALNPLSRDTGGTLFLTDRIAFAAHEIRSMRKCRYLVSFRKDPDAGKRSPFIDLELRSELQKTLTLFAPSSYQTQAHAPSKSDNDQALFLLPKFGRGIVADVTLWPYRPAGKRGRWNVFVVGQIERADNEPWPDDLTEIKITVLAHHRSSGYGRYTKTITGRALQAFKANGGTGPMLFPLEGIRPGETTIDLTATGNVEEFSANASKTFDVPHPPGPGEARPWFVSSHLDRVGNEAVMVPSFDDVVMRGEYMSLIGYGCAAEDRSGESYAGSIVPPGGGPAVPVPLTWLHRPDGTHRACGWLAGKLNAPLQAGRWTFKPPSNLGGEDASFEVPFIVVSPETDAQ
jgi:hypothetical protein